MEQKSVRKHTIHTRATDLRQIDSFLLNFKSEKTVFPVNGAGPIGYPYWKAPNLKDKTVMLPEYNIEYFHDIGISNIS